MILDLEKLKASPSDYDLYQIAYRRAGATTGVHDIGDISDLKIGPNLRFRLAEASIQHEAAIAAAKRAAAAPPPKPVEPLPPQIDIDADLKRDLQRAADQARATNRLNEYVAVGLEDTQANADLIKNFVETSAARGYWSYEVIEVAI